MKRNQQLQIPYGRGGVSQLVETADPLRGLPAGDDGSLEPNLPSSPATIWLPAVVCHVVLGMRW